jgi:hypothetical protein
MTKKHKMEPGQVLDTLGELIALLSAFAAKVPAKSVMSLPGGIRPAEEVIEKYEETVFRFREQAGLTYKALPPLFVDSLEAFEAGKVFDAVPPLTQSVEHLIDLHDEHTVTFTQPQQQRLREYYRRLEKIVPEASQPEVDLPTPETY